jgi:hypothetical protein
MSLDYTVKSNTGDVLSVSTNDLAQEFLGKGYKSASVTPDGQTMHVADSEGNMGQIDIAQFLGQNAQHVGFSPTKNNVDYSKVDSNYARKLELIGNDETSRQLLLKSQLAANGIKDAKIVGKGDDYYYFDPASNKYMALTNKPGMDLSDVQRNIPGVVNAAASLAGGLFGAAGGTVGTPIAGTIAGGAIGAAGGGMFARNLMKSIESAVDPEYRKILDKQTDTDGVQANLRGDFRALSPEAQRYMSEEAMSMGIDALGGGLGAAPIKGVQAALNNGIISRSAQGAGRIAEVAGGTVKKGADYLAGEGGIPQLARGLMAQATPLGPIQAGAYLARAGELIPMASRGAARATERVGQFLDNRAYDATLREASEEAVASAPFRDRVFGAAEKLRARNLAPDAEESLAQMRGRKFDNFFARKAGQATKEKPIAGVSPANIEQTIANYARGNGAEGSLNKLGQGLQTASDIGKATDKGVDRIMRGGINAVGSSADAVSKVGKYANRTGRYTAPLENRLLLQYGNQELPEYYRQRK